jgi:hypothetical protein
VLQASALSSKAAAVHAPVVIRSTPRTLQRVAGAQRCGAARVSAAADAYAAVKITVQGRHMDVTEAMKQYAESKVAKVRPPAWGFAPSRRLGPPAAARLTVLQPLAQ